MLFLYCKEIKLYMSYNICHIDVYIFDIQLCKIKTKITVLIKVVVHPLHVILAVLLFWRIVGKLSPDTCNHSSFLRFPGRIQPMHLAKYPTKSVILLNYSFLFLLHKCLQLSLVFKRRCKQREKLLPGNGPLSLSFSSWRREARHTKGGTRMITAEGSATAH